MSNYGLVFRDDENNRVLLGEFNPDGTIDEFFAIVDNKYDNLQPTVFCVVDVQREDNKVGLMDLHQFEMFRADGSADLAVTVIRSILGMQDGGQAMFRNVFEQITEELFEGTKH